MREIIAYFKKFYQKHGWLVILYGFLTVLHKVTAFITPQALEKLIDAAVNRNMSVFVQTFVANVLLTLLFVGVLFARSYTQELSENHVVSMCSERVLKDMLLVPFQKLRGNAVGHYVHLMERDIDRIKGLAFYDVTVFVTNVILTLCMLVYLFRTDWQLSLIVVITIPVFVAVTKVMLPRIEQAEEAAIEQAEEMNDQVNDFYTGNESIRAANAEPFFLARAQKAIQKLYRLQKKRAKANVIYDTLLITGLMNVANILIYCFGGLRVVQGVITIGIVNTFTLYFSSLWNSVEGFMDFLKEYKVKTVSLKRLADFHALSQETESTEELPAFQTLQAVNLGFSYGRKEILTGVSFELHKGEKLLIVGENGSGKSTLSRLLCKLVEPATGAMYYNNIPYPQINARQLRKRILLVPSEAFLIEGTVTENLWGESGGTQMLTDDVIVEKNGGNLSSGQKKQIQLARCLAADADVYILDEPFNYVDSSAKQLLWNEILHRFADKTLIVISHDPYPTKDCDRVLEL